MSGIPWSNPEELQYIIKAIEKGIHPEDIIEELNKRFGNHRTFNSIDRKLGRSGISYAHCIAKKNQKEPQKPISIVVQEDIEINRIRSQYNLLKKKYDQAVKELSNQAEVVDQLRECITALPAVRVAPPIILKKDKPTEETLFLLLSDIHAWEVVKRSRMVGINEYNRTIACHRLKHLADTIVDIAFNKLIGYKFNKLVIMGLGDFVSGNIHQDLVEGVEGNITEWTMELALVLSQMFMELASVFPEVEFVGIVGNHGRMSKKKNYKAGVPLNWDYLCYHFIRLMCAKQENIKFVIPESFFTLYKVYDYNILLFHGDAIQSYYGLPFYGIKKKITNLRDLLESSNRSFDYVAMGHFHERSIIDSINVEWLLNGSLIGPNEFSVGKLFIGSKPCQVLGGIHKNKGITHNWKIKLDNVNLKNKPVYRFK